MATRLAQVARYAGVSEATVSRVLHGRAGVAAGTRDAVLTALDVLGFRRPFKAPGETARLVGMVLPDLHNPIFPAYAAAMSGALLRRGLLPVLCTRTSAAVAEPQYIGMLLARQVAGIVFVGSSYADAGPRQVAALQRRRLPVVLINPADENPGVPRFGVDDAMAVELALGHLAALGHHRIGLVAGPPSHLPSARKIAAFRSASGLVARAGFSIEGGRAAAGRLLDRGATAVVCASDALALGAIRAARDRGLGVPGDVSVVGFDDSTYMAAADPPLTTVRQPVAAIGPAAVAALADLVEGLPVAGGETLFDPELIVRESTGPA